MPRSKKDGQFLNAKLPQPLFDRIQSYCERTRIPKTAVVEFALQEYMDKVDPVDSLDEKGRVR